MIYILPTQYTLYTHSEPRLEVGQPVVCVADALDEVGAPTILVDELVCVVAAPANGGTREVWEAREVCGGRAGGRTTRRQSRGRA